ncbi:MAG: hypothetical protein WCT26_05285 [Candidatus Buchananbacteria bacterium]
MRIFLCTFYLKPNAKQKEDGAMRKKTRKLGNILVRHGSLSKTMLKEALDAQKRRLPAAKSLGVVLKRLGYVKQEQICLALAAQFGIEFIRTIGKITPDVLAKVDIEVARFYRVVPIKVAKRGKREVIILAMEHPERAAMINNLKLLIGENIDFAVVAPEIITDALTRYYGPTDYSVSAGPHGCPA